MITNIPNYVHGLDIASTGSSRITVYTGYVVDDNDTFYLTQKSLKF